MGDQRQQALHHQRADGRPVRRLRPHRPRRARRPRHLQLRRRDVDAGGERRPQGQEDGPGRRLDRRGVLRRRASAGGGAWLLNGQKTWTTSAHFAEWYWVGARTDPDAPKHAGITLFLVPLDHPGITINGIWTMGDERTNDVFFDDVFVPDVARRRQREQRLPVHLVRARPRAVHDVHLLADAPTPRCALRLRARHRDRWRTVEGRSGRPVEDRAARHAGARSRACSGCGSSTRR